MKKMNKFATSLVALLMSCSVSSVSPIHEHTQFSTPTPTLVRENTLKDEVKRCSVGWAAAWEELEKTPEGTDEREARVARIATLMALGMIMYNSVTPVEQEAIRDIAVDIQTRVEKKVRRKKL